MFICLSAREVISLLANLNARKRTNTPMVHGIGIDQVTSPTTLPNLEFSPSDRHTGGGKSESDSSAASFPVHSVLQLNSRFGPAANADIGEKSGQDI